MNASPRLPPGLWCVIPVFNNAATVGSVARACRDRTTSVLVVDDGSTDCSVADLLRGTDIAVIRHAKRLGKGCALATGLREVRARGGRWMITIDADGQHLPDDLPALASAVEEAPQALVIGARDMAGPHVPASSKFGRSFSNFWVLLETGLALPDTQSGYRAYPVELIAQLPLKERHYDFEIEVLVRAAWAGIPVRSVPVRVWYPPAAERISHFDKRQDNLRLTALHTRLVLRRLLPWPVRRLVTPPPAPTPWRQPRVFFRSLLKTNASPAGLAVAAGLGVLLGALPVPGLHSLLILTVALRLHLNSAMALASQHLCMPPVVPLACIQVGHFLLHGRFIKELTLQTWLREAGHRYGEWWLGALLLAPLLAVITGLLAYPLIRRLQRNTP